MAQQRCANTFTTQYFQVSLVARTTFTDYFSHKTKHLRKIFFTLKTTVFVQATNKVSINTTFTHTGEVLHKEKGESF